MQFVLIVDSGASMKPTSAFGPFDNAEQVSEWRAHNRPRWHDGQAAYATRIARVGEQGELPLIDPRA